MADFMERLQPLREQIRANPRLQIGLVLILLIVLSYVLLVLGDWRAEKVDELAQARARLTQIQGLAEQQEWPERAESAQQMAAVLRAEIPAASSPGLAQADFQGWLREIVGQPSDSSPRLDVQAPVELEAPAGVVRVSATISGALPPNRVLQMINRIEGRTNLATIPAATIRSDGRNQTFSLTVHAFYELGTGEARP